MIDVARRVTDLIRSVVEEEGFELVHVEYSSGAGILRAYVDRPKGITVSDCAELSRRISVLLDVEDLIPHQYTLEVSSPGIERPLFSERDYCRFRGREARLVTVEKIENRRNFTGVIEDCQGGRVRLNCEGRIYEIPVALIKRGNLVYHFN